MRRGPKPIPTHLKVVRKTQRADRRNEAEPVAAHGRPEPPEFLTEAAKVEWDRVCAELEAMQLLAKSDMAVLASYCQAFSRWKDAETTLNRLREKDEGGLGLVVKTKDGNWIQNPIVGVANRAMDEMRRCALEFGLTPSSRTRVKANEPQGAASKTSRFFDS